MADSKLAGNPYMDDSLMNNLSNFSPKANQEFESKHNVPSKNKRRSSKSKSKAKTKSKSKMSQQDNNNSNEPFTFPNSVIKAPEITEFTQGYDYDKMDLKIEKYLLSKYSKEISECNHFYDDIIIRFVTGYRHIAKTPNEYDKRLEETENNFKIYLKWQKTSNFDNILHQKQINNLDVSKYMEGSYIYGQDKFGHPLLWDTGNKLQKNSDLTIHKECGEDGMDQVLSYILKLLHEVKIATNKHYGLPQGIVHSVNDNDDNKISDELKENESNGTRDIGIYRHCMIFDLSGFNAKKVLKDRKIHEYYTKRGSLIAPEMVHKVYVINAPWVFQNIWKILKAFLHPNTIAKTCIIGKDYMDELLKDIDINMIPPQFGGKGKWTICQGYIPSDYPIQLTPNQDHDEQADNDKE